MPAAGVVVDPTGETKWWYGSRRAPDLRETGLELGGHEILGGSLLTVFDKFSSSALCGLMRSIGQWSLLKATGGGDGWGRCAGGSR